MPHKTLGDVTVLVLNIWDKSKKKKKKSKHFGSKVTSVEAEITLKLTHEAEWVLVLLASQKIQVLKEVSPVVIAR